MTTVENKHPSVYGTMASILLHLNDPKEKSSLPGKLARIRNSIGKDDIEASEVWPILFPMLPESMLGTTCLTHEEKAILCTLQIYALGQQGTSKVAQKDKVRFARALRSIRTEDTAKALDRRFNVMMTAADYDEFSYYLRQLFQMAKTKGIAAIDYSALASDLYWYQQGQEKQVCLSWAADYYRPKLDDEKNRNENKETEK